jgi:replicative DNA helicase
MANGKTGLDTNQTSFVGTAGELTAARIPPQAVDVEVAVLGAMLIDKEAISRAVEILSPDDFYKPAHQKIFRAMTTLFDRSEPVDLITTVEELKRQGALEQIGGPLYVTELTQRVTTAANVEYHAHIILEKSLMRNLIGTTAEVSTRAFSDTEDALQLLDEAESKIFRISERRMRRTFMPMKTAITDAFHVLEAIHGKHGGVTGVPTGFTDLDSLTGGFQRSDLIIIAGRPSQGKTALALSLARNAALHHEKKTSVGIFSLEMSREQLVIRMLATEARVNAHKLRTGRLPEDDWKNLGRAAGRLAEAKIFLDDTPALSILELRAKARRLKAEHGIGLIIVDYLQLVQGPRNAENREREISWISRSLKALAKELDLPVIALSQLNRSPETRGGDKRPMLSDLRESGAIEQDSDVVMFVHRPEMFGIKEMKDDDGSMLPTEGLAQIIIGKQRNGPTGTVKLFFQREYAGFERLAPAAFEAAMFPADPTEEETPF